ncbi:mannitol 2-dehydrogenase [Palleronia marisminoris]|uniref:Mannitol 2-dehydrogenase n=1 Tax=Palleronia marisminoris TaxID=315423 RepID=A0A1Y5RBZ1_9RHOB|nr:mannitol dehydrogenase family protein [Palleronia marisminoris]SFG11899.1 mannitol 2-dehydrogenase [Palleronia marisminoris]SLN13860.1 Mannitol 2-dehydrogenase [Palleronia marisminoris]
MSIPLSQATLSDLPPEIRVPSYDRDNLMAGIIHIGLGNFHRAHQAWYLHRLMDQGLAHDWAIIGAGVRPADAATREKLLAQDCLTTLIELDPSGKSVEVTGSMIGYVPVAENNAPLIAHMIESNIRIVSLTVTEGGYYQNADGGFDEFSPDIVHDAQSPQTPKTAFGAMVEALRRRRDNGTGPFTCQSCDNLQGNGAILRQTVVGLARLSDPDLADWIDANCTFPNSMVDCIVPATGPAELALARDFGIADNVPVTHENFRQWVIEDRFCAGRPDWDEVGATFTEDVHAYEAMKIRILNGGHQVIANAGEILSVQTIAGCMEHPLIHALFRKVETEEIAPHVHAVPGTSASEYIDLIDKRFSNPEIRDTTRRVAFDGSSRHTGFNLPVVRDALKTDSPVEGMALVEALWARMCEGTRENGSVIEPNDPFWSDLQSAAKTAKERPRAWLEQRRWYGDLANKPRFADAFDRWLTMIWAEGAEAALKSYTGA